MLPFMIVFALGQWCPCKIESPANLLAGQSWTIEVHQDSFGHRGVAFGNSFVVPNGDWKPFLPEQSPGGVTYYACYATEDHKVSIILSDRLTEKQWREQQAGQARYEALMRGEIPK